jgi:hypothetical protein
MNFLKLSDNIERIECLTISSNKKWVAVCEKIKKSEDSNQVNVPSVSVYNTKSY